MKQERLNQTTTFTLADKFWDTSQPGGELAVPPHRALQQENFSFGTTEAVAETYLDQARRTLALVPVDLDGLEKMVRNQHASPYSREASEPIDEVVDAYVYPELSQLVHTDITISAANPFDLIRPNGLINIEQFTKEKNTQYQGRGMQKNQDQHRGYSLGRDPSYRKEENNYIRTLRGWNEHYVGFLAALNIPHAEARKEVIMELGRKTFAPPETGFSYLSPAAPLSEVAPFDNPTQWLVFQALNILHSPEEQLAPIARYRAIETLAAFAPEELKVAFLGTEQQTISERGRNKPVASYIQDFRDKVRLPYSFRQTTEEKTASSHPNWENNAKIVEIFGRDNRNGQPYDYGAIVNTLITRYPEEAVHVILLMTVGSHIHKKAGLEALIKLPSLDPLTKHTLFGRQASYLRMNMPLDQEAQIARGMGLAQTDDLAGLDLEGLSPEDLKQVTRRLAFRNAQLERQLAEATAGLTHAYFETLGTEQSNRIDPKGYWQILGVHPNTDPEDIDEIINRAWRVLVKKLYSGTTEIDPDNEAKLKKVNEAFDILKDKRKRAAYMNTTNT